MIVVKDNNGNYHQVTDGTSTVIPSLNVSQEILWENPNPTQSFAAQTVNLSDNPFNYDYIRILYNDDPRNSATGYSIIDIKPSDSNFKATIGLVIYSDSHRVTRQIYSPTENSITFNSTKAEDGTTWDGWLIPYQIIGMKLEKGSSFALPILIADGVEHTENGFTTYCAEDHSLWYIISTSGLKAIGGTRSGQQTITFPDNFRFSNNYYLTVGNCVEAPTTGKYRFCVEFSNKTTSSLWVTCYYFGDGSGISASENYNFIAIGY